MAPAAAFTEGSLNEMGWSALKRFAVAHNLVTQEQLDVVFETPKPKDALIAILLAAQPEATVTPAEASVAPPEADDGGASAADGALLRVKVTIARLEQALTDHGVSISFLVRTWEASEETASGTAEERVERAEVRASSRLPHHNLILRDVSPGSALQCC